MKRQRQRINGGEDDGITRAQAESKRLRHQEKALRSLVLV
jgi:hypothetical protein